MIGPEVYPTVASAVPTALVVEGAVGVEVLRRGIVGSQARQERLRGCPSAVAVFHKPPYPVRQRTDGVGAPCANRSSRRSGQTFTRGTRR
jgi:hypothetical protein